MKTNRTPVWRLGIHLDIASRQWQEAMNKNVSKTRFNRPHWLALCAVDELESNCNLTQISEYMKCEISTCSRALVFLENNGLIERNTDADDKRAKGISITSQGKELLYDLDLRADVSRKKLLKDVTPEQLKTFKYVIEKIKENTHQILLERKYDAGKINTKDESEAPAKDFTDISPLR